MEISNNSRGAIHIVGILFCLLLALAVFLFSHWLNKLDRIAAKIELIELKIESLDNKINLLELKVSADDLVKK